VPAITMGIDLVAFLAARTHSSPPATTITSTLRRTSSAASSEARLGFPSAYRYSMAMFCLSMWPRSRSATRIASERADSLAASPDDIYPIRGTFFGCCASADEQSAKSREHRAKQTTFLLIEFLSVYCFCLATHAFCLT